LTADKAAPNLSGMETIFDLVNARAGSQAELARKLGISAASIVDWRRVGRIPAERVLEVSRVTGLSPHLLRPDIYPDPKWAPPT
jgi:DNA-binding transcriptional regulator YdaS (Cro superfamily)